MCQAALLLPGKFMCYVKVLFLLTFTLFVCSKYCSHSPSPLSLMEQTACCRINIYNEGLYSQNFLKIKINLFTFPLISLLGLGLITVPFSAYLHQCKYVRYVAFNKNLSLLKKKVVVKSPPCSWTLLSFTVIIGLLLSKCDNAELLLLFTCMNPNFEIILSIAIRFNKIISWILFSTLPIFMFSIAVSTAASILGLLTFQIWCLSCVKNIPHWLPIILIILSNDVQLNPGPRFENNFFNFMSWNLNSLVKNKFERVSLIEAHNSNFNYDLISICETSLNDSLVPEVPELDGYTFLSANHPGNVTHGGVGLFYKNRKDLSFDESIFYCIITKSCF